ncbi:MAG: glycoside hydrolase family 2 protein [Bacteroidales bacterium]|nr:glycoside hydrolase family 2 protein [Bacteroidales bacterium]
MSCFLIIPKLSLSQLEWPEIRQETRPWSRWWWMGNILPENDLKQAMEEYAQAGLGGLEITPIYGVKGSEEKFIPFLSPEYMKKLDYVLEEAQRTGLGIDMATGTGWPFGGPWVNSQDACKYMTFKTYKLKTGEKLDESIVFYQRPLVRAVNRRIDIGELTDPVNENEDLQSLALDQVRFPKPLPLILLMAYGDNGTVLDLTKQTDANGKLNWTAPEGRWTLYALFQGWHGKMVERAAPGGEGNVIDHFSGTALDNYLKKFDNAFKDHDISSLRAFFNDSYEVDDARGESNWTPDFLDEFLKRRGYDLRHQLPALFGQDTAGGKNFRVLCDYRQTVSELILEEFTTPWHEWAKGRNAIIRNQAHGSPANILDLYAASDIPECEGEDLLRIKFASSAAHVTGKPLTSSESATWLNEHFLSTLGAVKHALDRFMLGGVNHIFYHGTTFSPRDEPWPGWMFYASVHFGPTNTWWKDFSRLNRYVTRCQSFLQDGSPDNEILLYFNFYDRISVPGNSMLQHFKGGATFTTARDAGEMLIKGGYSFDFFSDSQLRDIKSTENQLHTAGGSYKTIILPECHFIPLQTFERIIKLANDGATIIIHKMLPYDVEGFADLENRQKKLAGLLSRLQFETTHNPAVKIARTGSGFVLLGEDINALLAFAKVKKETMIDKGLQFIRRKHKDGCYYFIVNQGEKVINGWVPLAQEAKSIALFNPMTEESGMGAVKSEESGNTSVYLQLEPGESMILKTFSHGVTDQAYPIYKAIDKPYPVSGTWSIAFTEGGPDLPGNIKTGKLKSWTDLGGDELKRFSGTAGYAVSFSGPKIKCRGWYLDLGRVAESARVSINGKALGTIITEPFRIYVPPELIRKKNLLEIEVTNLMANRMAYMDQQGLAYKKFYNVNFPGRLRENTGEDGLFTAAKWPPKESGLMGPVTLTPLEMLVNE